MTIYAAGAPADLKPCFALEANQRTCPDPATGVDVKIKTGDTVTWDFDIDNGYHNAYPAPTAPSTPPDADWDKRKPMLTPNGTDSYTFGKAGVYKFVCQAHPSMFGTITVEGGEVATPEPTATETPTPLPTETATPAATASPAPTSVSMDDHTSTPAPARGATKDGEAPRLSVRSVKRAHAGARVRFWLSEPATVTVSARRSRTVVAKTVVQAPAGTSAFTLRAGKLRKGSYTVSLKAVDAMGNRGPQMTKGFKVR
ncbi:MAG TPA: plastocyanin/azurin family copper-binding protein [Solirubrobacter sp.]|nr:plastocyanin/azurin family copper-binding protein [Solirubrobacter sp.]